mgnify:CR=1 FL=1
MQLTLLAAEKCAASSSRRSTSRWRPSATASTSSASASRSSSARAIATSSIQLPGIQDPAARQGADRQDRRAAVQARARRATPSSSPRQAAGAGGHAGALRAQRQAPAGDAARGQPLVVESSVLMTGDVVSDARVRPGDAAEQPHRRLDLQRARRAAVRRDHRGQRQPPARDRARRHDLFGAGDPASASPAARADDQRQLHRRRSTRSGDRAAHRRAAGAGDGRRGAHRRPDARARTRSGRASARSSSAAALVIIFMLFYYRFAGLLRRSGADLERALPARGAGGVRRDADPAGHRRHRADARHGGRRQRADQRAHPRGAAPGQDRRGPPSTRATSAPCRRSSTPTSRRSSPASSSSSSAPGRSKASP